MVSSLNASSSVVTAEYLLRSRLRIAMPPLTRNRASFCFSVGSIEQSSRLSSNIVFHASQSAMILSRCVTSNSLMTKSLAANRAADGAGVDEAELIVLMLLADVSVEVIELVVVDDVRAECVGSDDVVDVGVSEEDAGAGVEDAPVSVECVDVCEDDASVCGSVANPAANLIVLLPVVDVGKLVFEAAVLPLPDRRLYMQIVFIVVAKNVVFNYAIKLTIAEVRVTVKDLIRGRGPKSE